MGIDDKSVVGDVQVRIGNPLHHRLRKGRVGQWQFVLTGHITYIP